MVSNTEETHSHEHKTSQEMCQNPYIIPLASEPTQVVPHLYTLIFTLTMQIVSCLNI